MHGHDAQELNFSSVLAEAYQAAAEIAVITNAAQAIVYVSPTFSAMTGYEMDDVLGRNCRFLQGPGTDPHTIDAIRNALASGQVFDGEILNYRKDGSPFWTILRIVPMRTGTGTAITHFVSVQRDISNLVALLNHMQEHSRHELPNRIAAGRHVDEVVRCAPDSHMTVAVGRDGGATTEGRPRASPESCREALRTGNIVIHLQPVVDLRDGSIHLFEALARLQLPGGRTAHPDEFLPHLEAADLRILFAGVLTKSLETLAAWDHGGIHHHVSVNLPPAALLDQETPALVQRLLLAHDIQPQRLGLELLESESVDLAEQWTTLRELVDLGVGLALDDLGSGYSSLQRLSSFPFSAIKLDRGLFDHVIDRPVETLSIIATLIQLGRDLGMNVVVEGLENRALTEAVATLGAPLGQGYYLAKPMPPDDCLRWLETFELSAQRSTISTPLGALAYHWRFARLAAPHPLDVERCPLTPFLAEVNASTRTKERHSHQHEIPVTHPRSSEYMLAWLIALIRNTE